MAKSLIPLEHTDYAMTAWDLLSGTRVGHAKSVDEGFRRITQMILAITAGKILMFFARDIVVQSMERTRDIS